MSFKNVLTDIAQNPKVGAATATVTATAGTFLDWLPDALLTKLAAVVGIALSVTLIIVQIRKARVLSSESQLIELKLRRALEEESARQSGYANSRSNGHSDHASTDNADQSLR